MINYLLSQYQIQPLQTHLNIMYNHNSIHPTSTPPPHPQHPPYPDPNLTLIPLHNRRLKVDQFDYSAKCDSIAAITDGLSGREISKLGVAWQV